MARRVREGLRAAAALLEGVAEAHAANQALPVGLLGGQEGAGRRRVVPLVRRLRAGGAGLERESQAARRQGG